MLSKEINEKLTRVGPGTPMGELMRRYWHPIAASRELDDSPFRTKGVRVLGEDLVLYRDRSGTHGLIERYCPHRRVDLAIGVVENDGLRCQYHGWKFNSACNVRRAAIRGHHASGGQFPRQVRHCWLSGAGTGGADLCVYGPATGAAATGLGATHVEQRGTRHRDHQPAVQLASMPGK